MNGEVSEKPIVDEIVEEWTVTSAKKISRERLQEQQSDEFEDDDFGDFEEAAPIATLSQQEYETDEAGLIQSEFDRPSCSRSISCDSQTQYNISDVIDDDNLWVFDELVQQSETKNDDSKSATPVIIELEVCDILHKFDLCDSYLNEQPNIETFNIESLKLWTLLCYVEETVALKFLWNRSFTYTLLLDALQINVKKISVSEPLANSLPSYSQSYSLSEHSVSLTLSTVSNSLVTHRSGVSSSFEHSLLPDASIDSLSVAPADFDWKTSGLMNPLTGATIGALSAVLECDFFSSDTNSNGQSILERDLQDLGLSNGHFSPSSTRSTCNILPVNLNQLMQNGQQINTTTNSMCSPSKQYKKVEELSLGAQALHNRLPDHTYMLASHLMFPLNHHQQH